MTTLEQCRLSTQAWQSVAYLEQPRDDGYGVFDGNAKARYWVLSELQFDFQTNDEALIRFLCEQEICAIEQDSFQGFGEALSLVCYLLARFKNKDDIALFYRAKKANFDTYCGFDSQFIFWPLEDKTPEYIRQVHPEFDLDLSDDDIIADLPRWWSALQNEFTADREKLEPLTLFERFVYLQDINKAQFYLSLMLEQDAKKAEPSMFLVDAYQSIMQYEQAISTAKALMQQTKPAHDSIRLWLKLLAIFQLLNNTSEALKCIENIQREKDSLADWGGSLLTQDAAIAGFEFAKECDDLTVSKQAFFIAEHWFESINNKCFVLLQAAHQAAVKCGLGEQMRQLEKLANQERDRVNQELAQIGIDA